MSGVTLTGIELFSVLPADLRPLDRPRAFGDRHDPVELRGAGFIVRSFMHRLAQRYTEVGVLTGSLFVAASPISSCPAWRTAGCWRRPRSPRPALGSAQPLTIILTYNHAPAGRSGEALGMRIMANKVTQIAVPLAFGGFGAAMGAVPVFSRPRYFSWPPD